MSISNASSDSHQKPALGPLQECVEITALSRLSEVAGSLEEGRTYWGYYTTPKKARLRYSSKEGWERTLAKPRLQEARIFDSTLDVHWLGNRGVRLRVDEASAGTVIAGEDWLQADRRSRLWGEWLEGTRGDKPKWYEARIPDPVEYEGLEPGKANRFAFLLYREYIRDGAVQYVRFLGVEGSDR